jgi:hypothetical protein
MNIAEGQSGRCAGVRAGFVETVMKDATNQGLGGRRGGVCEPTDDFWWVDVLNDPRARRPSRQWLDKEGADSRYRLDRQGPAIFAHCPCGKSRVIDRDE